MPQTSLWGTRRWAATAASVSGESQPPAPCALGSAGSSQVRSRGKRDTASPTLISRQRTITERVAAGRAASAIERVEKRARPADTLRDADVQRDRAEAEAAIAHVAQARAAHRVGEAGRAREALDRLRQVGVRRPIAGNERADDRHDAVEVDAEHAIPAGHARPRDLEGDDEAPGP